MSIFYRLFNATLRHLRKDSTANGQNLALQIKRREHRNMVGRLFPTARRAQDAAGVSGGCDIGGGPDMIQTAAFIGGIPIGGAVGPPAEQGTSGNILAGDIDPSAISV